MARDVRKSKAKKMRPIFFVFCEGETEVAYVNYLKSKYRLPIQIVPKKSDSNISCRYIENCKREYFTTASDKTFLMYDLDVDGVLDKLTCIPEVTLLVSNPCVELWFLLHNQECKSELDSKRCIAKYESVSPDYKKGSLNAFPCLFTNYILCFGSCTYYQFINQCLRVFHGNMACLIKI